MKKIVKVYSIINAGIYVDIDGIGICIDAINKSTDFFNGISEKIFEDMLYSQNFFSDFEYLVYTHCHQDHFMAERNIDYIRTGKVKELILPYSEKKFFIETCYCAQQSKTNTNILCSEDKKGEIKFEDFNLTYSACEHSGAEFKDIMHFAYILDFDGLKMFVGSDSDFLNMEQHTFAFGKSIDIAFINPFYLTNAIGREIIEKFDAKKIFIYHLPQPEKDIFGIRKQTEKALKKYSDIQFRNKDIEVLYEPMKLIFCKKINAKIK